MLSQWLKPSPIRSFALKALGIFVLWYVLYELWLLQDGRLDYWVALKVIDGADFVIKIFGFAVIIGLYFFLVRPIRVGFISVLLDYMEPALPALKEVGIRNSATTLILSIGNQDTHSLKRIYLWTQL